MNSILLGYHGHNTRYFFLICTKKRRTIYPELCPLYPAGIQSNEKILYRSIQIGPSLERALPLVATFRNNGKILIFTDPFDPWHPDYVTMEIVSRIK